MEEKFKPIFVEIFKKKFKKFPNFDDPKTKELFHFFMIGTVEGFNECKQSIAENGI